MEMEYDEDLRENCFFQEIHKRYESLIRRAKRETWIVCVPRRGSFSKGALDEEDVIRHMLVPCRDSADMRFRTLNGIPVTLSNSLVIVGDDRTERTTSYLLFEETFYERDSSKYRVWCIERPLREKRTEPQERTEPPFSNVPSAVTSLREAVAFLSGEIFEAPNWKNVTALIVDFREKYEQGVEFEEMSIEEQRVGTVELYLRCLGAILKSARLSERFRSDDRFARMLQLSLETYLLYCLRDVLSRSVSARTAHLDAKLNRSLRSSSDLNLEDLQVRPEFHDRIHAAKLKLARLNRFSTILGKIECLKRTVRCLSYGLPAMSTDDLLPALVYLVIKVGLSNWHAQITFLKNFRLGADSVTGTDEASFLTSSIEAALEHARNAASIYPTIDAFQENEPTERASRTSRLFKFSRLKQLLEHVRKGELREVERMVILREKQVEEDRTSSVVLCHPLCVCDLCERNRCIRDVERDFITWPMLRAKDESGIAAIHVAASYGRANVLRFLLANGVDVNTTDIDGRSALHHAAASGHSETLLVLLQANANPLEIDCQGNTALHLAAERGHEDCTRVLLSFIKNAKSNFDPNPTNYEGDTPLHRASKWGYLVLVRILMAYGANPEARNKRCQTPLSLAHNKYVLNSLADTRQTFSKIPSDTSDLSFIASSSSSVLSSPSSSRHRVSDKLERAMEKLFAAIKRGDTCLACYYLGLENQPSTNEARSTDNMCHPLCDCERCEIQEKCSRTGRRRTWLTSKDRILTVNTRNRDGETALHAASAVNATEIVRILLDAGANVNARTELEQRTPLHTACVGNNVNVIRLLLECATCELDAKDHNGDTPLHLAVKVGNSNIVTLLVRYGAQTNLRNSEGMTPLLQLQQAISKDAPFSLNLVYISNVLKRNSIENARA